MNIDPTGLHLESHTPPIWEQEEDFSQIVSEQLRRAPWLAISVLGHVLALVVLYLALDAPFVLQQPKCVSMQTVEPEQEIPEDEPEQEPIEDEVVPEQEMKEYDVTDTQTETENVTDDHFSEADSTAFDSDQWNPAVGIGGGGGGCSGGDGLGRTKRRDRARAPLPAIDDGLKWLRDHQDEDGKWDCDAFMKHDARGAACDGAGNPVHDVGVTGLALLAFLGNGSTMRSGEYRDTVKKAVKWLRAQQGDSGLFGMSNSHDFIYDHAIATYAMCEAYGLSDYRTLRRYAEGGIRYLESHRNPYGCWRYQPRDNDNDLSVTGWCIMAYKSAKDFKLDVNAQALKLCTNFIDELTDPASGRCGYTKRGEPSSRHVGDHATRFPVDKGEAMTAVGLFCRFFLGQDPKHVPVMRLAADSILHKPPIWDKTGGIDHYYWYYASYALYQMGPPHWDRWRKQLDTAVVKTQRKDGNFKGSWDPAGAWGEDGGRVYSTAILVLTLEAYYRYSRLVR